MFINIRLLVESHNIFYTHDFEENTYALSQLLISRGGSNSIAKYCNTFAILQYLLQYFEIL